VSAATPPVDDTARHRAARVWTYRTRAEREAAGRFAALAGALQRTGAHPQVVAMAQAAAGDERVHAERCARLVVHLGATAPEDARVDVREVAPSGLALAPRGRVLYEVVAMSCLTETLSTALLGAMVTRATDPLVRRTVQRILADEVRHGRLGWAHVASQHARGPCGLIGDHLPAMLRDTVPELFDTAADEEAPDAALALEGLGLLDRPTRVAIFTATMRDVVFPGLERFGIDTAAGRRWLDAASPGAATS
jgi:hypothetical protein